MYVPAAAPGTFPKFATGLWFGAKFDSLDSSLCVCSRCVLSSYACKWNVMESTVLAIALNACSKTTTNMI